MSRSLRNSLPSSSVTSSPWPGGAPCPRRGRGGVDDDHEGDDLDAVFGPEPAVLGLPAVRAGISRELPSDGPARAACDRRAMNCMPAAPGEAARPTVTATPPRSRSPRGHTQMDGGRGWDQRASRRSPGAHRLGGHDPEVTGRDVEDPLVMVRAPSTGSARHDQVTERRPSALEPNGLDVVPAGQPAHVRLEAIARHLSPGDDDPRAGRVPGSGHRVATGQRSPGDRRQFFCSALPSSTARVRPLPQDPQHWSTFRQHVRNPASGGGSSDRCDRNGVTRGRDKRTA
jgi:hypothetical protein